MNREQRPRLGVLVLPAWYPSPADPFAGIFVRSHVRAGALAHDVAVAADGGAAPVAGLYRVEESRDDGIRTFRIFYRRSRIPRLDALGYLLGIIATVRRLRADGQRVDVLHAHVHRAAWAAVIVGKLLRLPVVVSEHSSEFRTGSMTKGAVRRARFAFSRAAVVCPVSEDLRAHIEQHGISARFEVVPNAVDTNVFHPPPAAERRPSRRLLAVAMFRPIKGLDVLLDAVALLAPDRRDFELVVFGDGPARPQYEAKLRHVDLTKLVTLSGVRPPADIAEAMRASDVFVLPSRSENMPVALLEALASGLPVVASAVGGVPEVVSTGNGVLVPPGDAALLAQSISDVLDRLDDFDRAAIAGAARSAFSLEAIGARWTAIYRAVVAVR